MRLDCVKWRCLLFFILLMLIPIIALAQTDHTLGLAVLNLQANGISQVEATALSDMLRSGITKTITEQKAKLKDTYALIERSQIDKILEEFDFQNKVCTDISCAVEFGKLLSADRIIIGSVSLVGSTYMVIARIVDVESGRAMISVDRKQTGVIDNVIDLMPIVAHELLTGEKLPSPVPTMQKASPLATAPHTAAPQQQIQQQFISVQGNPERATVLLDDEKMGETPIDYKNINPGRYTMKITADGFKQYEKEIVIAPGANEIISYKLNPLASITVSGIPEGAIVLLDGKEAGKTPLTKFYVSEGSHEVIIKHDGYLESKENISFNSGSEKTLSYKLTTLSSISVLGRPAKAAIIIDGKNVGNSPLEGQIVTEGEHAVKVTLKGYETFTKNVKVIAGNLTTVDFFLIPKTKKGVMSRSLFLPGLGQSYAGYKGKGAFITVLQVAALGGVVAVSLSAQKKWSDYDEAKSAYKNADSDADFNSLYVQLESKHDDASSASTLQMITIGAAAAIYIYNVVDALMTVPDVEVNPDFGTLKIEPVINKEYSGVSMKVRF